MDFALNQKTMPKLGFAAFLDLAAELGCVCVEPRNDLGRPIFDRIEPVRAGEMARERGLRFIGLSEVYPFNDWNEDRRAAVAGLIETAQAAGAETVSFIPRVDGRGGDGAERAKTLRAVLAEILPMLHGTGIVGLVEPIGFSTSSIKFQRQATQAIGSLGANDRFGIVHDTFQHALADRRSVCPAGSYLGHSGWFRRSHRRARRAAHPCRRERPERHCGPDEETSRGRLHCPLFLRMYVSAHSKHRRSQGADQSVNQVSERPTGPAMMFVARQRRQGLLRAAREVGMRGHFFRLEALPNEAMGASARSDTRQMATMKGTRR